MQIEGEGKAKISIDPNATVNKVSINQERILKGMGWFISTIMVIVILLMTSSIIFASSPARANENGGIPTKKFSSIGLRYEGQIQPHKTHHDTSLVSGNHRVMMEGQEGSSNSRPDLEGMEMEVTAKEGIVGGEGLAIDSSSAPSSIDHIHQAGNSAFQSTNQQYPHPKSQPTIHVHQNQEYPHATGELPGDSVLIDPHFEGGDSTHASSTCQDQHTTMGQSNTSCPIGDQFPPSRSAAIPSNLFAGFTGSYTLSRFIGREYPLNVDESEKHPRISSKSLHEKQSSIPRMNPLFPQTPPTVVYTPFNLVFPVPISSAQTAHELNEILERLRGVRSQTPHIASLSQDAQNAIRVENNRLACEFLPIFDQSSLTVSPEPFAIVRSLSPADNPSWRVILTRNNLHELITGQFVSKAVLEYYLIMLQIRSCRPDLIRTKVIPIAESMRIIRAQTPISHNGNGRRLPPSREAVPSFANLGITDDINLLIFLFEGANPGTYSMFYVDYEKWIMEYVDPKRKAGMSQVFAMKDYLKAQHEAAHKEQPDWSSWRCGQSFDFQSIEPKDDAVFIMMIAERLTRRIPFEISGYKLDEGRIRMTYEIVNNFICLSIADS